MWIPSTFHIPDKYHTNLKANGPLSNTRPAFGEGVAASAFAHIIDQANSDLIRVLRLGQSGAIGRLLVEKKYVVLKDT